MASSNSRYQKEKRGRPRTGIGRNIGLRLYPDLEAALDAWIAKQPDPKALLSFVEGPSKPEAIRRILREVLFR